MQKTPSFHKRQKMNTLNQTLQEKFPHLELSVLKLSEVQRDNESLILGSNFNSNTRRRALQTLKSNNTVSDYFDLINTTISSITEPSYIYDLTHSLGNFLQDVDLTQDALGSNKKEVKENDFIISRLRSYLQEMAVIQTKNYKQLVSTEYLVYRPKTNLLSSNALMVFALSEIVQTILNCSQYGTEHPRFYEFVFNELPIPEVIIELNNQINFIMIESYKALEQSKALYKQAEDLLYTELGLNPQNPMQSILQSHSNGINFRIATLKESFLKTGRLDSEYYQVKYEEIKKRIKTYTNGYCKLKDIVVSFSGGFAFSSNEYLENGDLALIRINNIKNANLDMNNAVYLNNEAISLSPKDKVKKGDILISMSGSIGLSCMVRENLHAMVNQRILKISIDNFNADVLVLLLNSVLCKLQFERIGTGGVQTNLATSDILNILIPKINPNTQDSIASHIQQSFTLRNEAKALLEEAKAKVESAIIGGGGGK